MRAFLLAFLALAAVACVTATAAPALDALHPAAHPLQEKLGLHSAAVADHDELQLAAFVDSGSEHSIQAPKGVGTRCGSGGTCKLTSGGCRGGTFRIGLCPGGANVRCCQPAAKKAAAPAKKAAAPAAKPSGSNASKRDRFVQILRSKLGAKYVWGAAGPNTFDCSGLIYWAAKQAGVNIPRTANDQFKKAGKAVNSVAARQPGDLIFFGKPGQRVYHVGVHLGPNQMINAPNPTSVVRLDNYSYWPDRVTQARRIF